MALNMIRMAITVICLLLATRQSTAHQGATRPNFIVVFIDDMGWADLSCFGGQGVTTQNIDRLAAEGLSFESFYVASPICSPSRTALTTGQYPARWRITSYLADRMLNQRRGMAQWLDPQAPTLAQHLQQAGYATGHFGKWHLGGQRDVGDAPLIEEYGFDASLTNFEGLGPRVLPLCDAYDGTPPKRHALGSDQLDRGTITWVDRSQITTAFVRRAVEFMDESVRHGKPFYINLWPDDVHSPFFPPQARRGDAAKRTLYRAVLDTMDEQLGVLFDHLRANEQLRNNTLVLLASDNGPEPGAGSAGVLRGAKGTLYEGGIRSPLIVWGPGFIAPGKQGTRNKSSVLVSLDLVPTLLKIANVPVPKNVMFDGVESSDVLLGRVERERPAPMFWKRPPDRPGPRQEPFPDLAVREGSWKLLAKYDGSQPQLYDLAEDAGETNNLADQHPQIAHRLLQALLAWHAALPADAGPMWKPTMP